MKTLLSFMNVSSANIDAWSRFIKTLGFPIVICLYFAFQSYQQNQFNQNLIDSLRQDNRIMITTLSEVKNSIVELSANIKK
jgi:hypothetical protein